MTIKFSSNNDGVTAEKIVAAHVDLYVRSETYRNMVDEIIATGRNVSIYVGEGGSLTNPVTYTDSSSTIRIDRGFHQRLGI